MSPRLSPDTEAVVKAIFKLEDWCEATRLLVEECGNNLVNEQYSDEYDLEDIRIQVLSLSRGDLPGLRHAIDIANQDWRDLSVHCTVGTREFKLKALGDTEGLRRYRHLVRLHLALTWGGAVIGFGLGVGGTPWQWLVAPVLLIAIAMELRYRVATNHPVRWREMLFGTVGTGVPRWFVLAGLIWVRLLPGSAIAGGSYLFGVVTARMLAT